MNTFTKGLMLASALLLAACDEPQRFGTGADGTSDYHTEFGQVELAAATPDSPQYFQQFVGDSVLFAVDAYTLSAEARDILDGQAEWLIENSDFDAIVEGHADERGTREYNLALGDRRANAARDYLISRGIAGNRIKTVSYGKERPAQLCSNESCYSQNRRSVTSLVAGF